MEDLAQALRDLDEKKVHALVEEEIKNGVPVMEIVRACNEGMVAVGELFSECKYFISELIFSAEILKNVMKRLVILGNEDQILEELKNKIDSQRVSQKASQHSHLSEIPNDDPAGVSLKDMSKTLTSTAEREVILRALQQTQWNRKQAAIMLNISYKTLLNKIKRLDIK